jgi:AAA family ATP:ADP antiporter
VADTFFVRTGDGFAALTVLVGTRALQFSIKYFLIFNMALAFTWICVATLVVRENRRLLATNAAGGGQPVG